MSARIIAVANQKGGVGKTTTSINLTAALRERGKRVLLCDFDPQGNATSGMGIEKGGEKTVYDAICGESSAKDVIISTDYGDVMPSDRRLAGAEIELVGESDREYKLKNIINTVKDNYDYVIIDCPPSLGLLPLNSFCAADGILVPVQCEYYALEGLSDLMYTLRAVKKKLNPSLQLEGLVLTMFDSRTNLSSQVASEVKRFFPGKVYGSVIPRNVRLSEAPSYGQPVIAYDRSSRGADAYLKLASEIDS